MAQFDDEEFKEHLRDRNIDPDMPEGKVNDDDDVPNFYLQILKLIKEKSEILNSAINSSIKTYNEMPETSPLKKEFEDYVKSLMKTFLKNIEEFESLLRDLE